MFQDLPSIRNSGFVGFKTIEQLWNDSSCLPNEKGVYVVINPHCSKKQFLAKGVGGFFKGKNPNISLEELTSHWIEDCHILYIGQAGGNGSSATLKKRLKQYLDFGKGKPVGHYGGRLIWQLLHHKDLLVAWKNTKFTNPREEERAVIRDFHNNYGRLPFANLTF